jgi:hypothetical protein
MLRRKFQGITKNLEEENKILRDLEKAGRNKLNISRQFTVQQQDTISNLLEVKSMQKYFCSLGVGTKYVVTGS